MNPNSKNNRDFNPYDLDQVSKVRKIRTRRLGVRSLSRTDDPYSTSASTRRIKR